MRIDFHVHSRYSPDARGDPREILRMAQARGLDAIAFTDHNEVRGGLEAQRQRSPGEPVVIRGSEVSSTVGHVLAYGIGEAIPRPLAPEEVVERVHALGGVAVAAHPYRFWSGVGEGTIRRVTFDAVEARNARSIRAHNRRADHLASDVKLPRTAGSDAHAPEQVGRATATILEEGLGEDDIIEAIVKGRAEVSGSSRSFGRTLGYTTKCVSEWMLRGMRRI